MRNWSRYSSVLPSYMAGESRSRVKMRLRIKKTTTRRSGYLKSSRRIRKHGYMQRCAVNTLLRVEVKNTYILLKFSDIEFLLVSKTI